MASIAYNQMPYSLVTQAVNLATDDVRVALVTNGYTPNPDDRNWNQVVLHEAAGEGYDAYGKPVTLVATIDDMTDVLRLTSAAVTWSEATVAARYAVIYKKGVDDETSPLLLCLDFSTDRFSVDGTFTLQWDEGLVLTIGQAVV